MTTQREIDRLIAELDDCRTRAQARRALERMGAATADKLMGVLATGGGSANKRWAVISLLGGCRHQGATAVLLGVMRDEPSLRADARRALEAITGRDLGDDADAWEAGLAAGEETPRGPPEEQAAPPAESRPEEELARQAIGDLAESITWEGPDSVCVLIPAGTAGVLQVRLDFGSTDRRGDPLVCIHTDCGPATPSVQAIMFRHNVTLRHGRYSAERVEDGGQRAVWRHHAPPARLTPKHLRDVLLALVNDVEQLRNELTQGERTYPWRARTPTESG